MSAEKDSKYFPIAPESAVQASSEPVKLFDITCTIGSVFSGGEHSPRVVAFMLIAEHGVDGEYSFPADKDGALTVVSVATVQEKR